MNGPPWLRFAVASAGGGRSARQRGADAWPRREADRIPRMARGPRVRSNPGPIDLCRRLSHTLIKITSHTIATSPRLSPDKCAECGAFRLSEYTNTHSALTRRVQCGGRDELRVA